MLADIANKNAAKRQSALRFLLDEQEGSSISSDVLTILLSKIACEDSDAAVRRVALNAPQIPIRTLHQALNDVDGELRCDAFGLLLSRSCGDSDQKNVQRALSLLLDEVHPRFVVKQLHHIKALFENNTLSRTDLIVFMGDDSAPQATALSQSYEPSNLKVVLRDLAEHDAVNVRSGTASTLGIVVRYCIKENRITSANCMFNLLLHLLSDMATEVSRSAANAVLNAITKTDVLPDDFKLMLEDESVIGLLRLHGGRANTTIQTEDARLVHAVLNKMYLPNFTSVGLVLTFLKRRLSNCPVTQPQPSPRQETITTQEIIKSMNSIESRHKHLCTIFNIS